MSSTEISAQQRNKIDRYIDLLTHQEKLIKSSRSIIRKKQSPLARKINNGDVSAIIKASKDRIYGSITKEMREELCRLFCDLRNRIKNKIGSETVRELIVFAINAAISLFSNIVGLIIERIMDNSRKIRLSYL